MIKVGDRVHVTLYIGENSEKGFDATVEYVPQVDYSNGCWIFLDDNRQLRYVKDFVQIIKK